MDCGKVASSPGCNGRDWIRGRSLVGKEDFQGMSELTLSKKKKKQVQPTNKNPVLEYDLKFSLFVDAISISDFASV